MHLTWDNQKVRKRELWGTDIYTDDSDVVAGTFCCVNDFYSQYCA